MFKVLYLIVALIWQFPQTIFGFCLSKFFDKPHIGPGGFKYVLVRSEIIPCIVLGEYVFIGNTELVRFGYGRGTLSRQFGPLFLPLISLPSIALLMLGKNWYLGFYGTRKSIEYGFKVKAA